MDEPLSTERRLFDLRGYLSDAIDDLLAAAQACDSEAARSDLTDEVMRLFEASAELCRAMRRFAAAQRDRPLPDAGIASQARLCSGHAPP